MLARNALMVVVASALTAVAASAQQPAKPAAPRSTAQAPAAAKQAAAATLPVSSDSAKKIVAANAPGATVSSAHLKRNAGKAYYSVSYKMKGDKKPMHATVDANTGAFAPAAAKSAKKPS
jgi:uncharacterized membrane protein YkoI